MEKYVWQKKEGKGMAGDSLTGYQHYARATTSRLTMYGIDVGDVAETFLERV
jgi:hypothetical protein